MTTCKTCVFFGSGEQLHDQGYCHASPPIVATPGDICRWPIVTKSDPACRFHRSEPSSQPPSQGYL